MSNAELNSYFDVIIAGCGDLGMRIARRLMANHITVLGLRRHVDPQSSLPLRAMDLTDVKSMQQAQLRCKVLLYTATPDERTDAGYLNAYVQGLACTQKYIDHKRLIFVSSTRVYDSGAVTEVTSVKPSGFAANRLVQAEHLLADTDCRLRLTGLYGPGRTSLVRKAAAGAWSDQLHWTNRIHIEDAASLASLLIEKSLKQQPVPAVVIGTDQHPTEISEVLTFLRSELHVAQNPEQKVTFTDEGKRCQSELYETLGFKLAYPDYRTAYRAIIKEYLGETE